MTRCFCRRDFVRLALVLLVAASVWLVHGHYWNATNWSQPASYNVDALETLARFQLAAEQGLSVAWHPQVERLGAPWTADWASYPLPDTPWYTLVGVFVRTIGLMPASHVALLGAHLMAVGAMFAAARLLGQRPVVAGAVALLFGFAHAISYRGLSHHSFMLAYVAPLGLLNSALVARSRFLLRRRSVQLFCLVGAAATGAGNPYFIFLYLQLLGFALGWQLWRERRSTNLMTGFVAGAVCVLVFLALNFPAVRAAVDAEGDHAFRRDPREADIYGLRPTELVTPPPRHHWRAAARFAEEEAHSQPLAGERFSSYLGIFGLVGGLVLAVGGARWLIRSRGRGYRPGGLSVAAWIFAFSTVGGINTWLAHAGFDVFRAGNRYSVYLAALALLALGTAVSRRLRARCRWSYFAVAAAVALGLWDQLPRPLPDGAVRDIGALVVADRAVARALADRLPAGAMVFQAPAPPFPEAGPVRGMADYEHLRGYLHNPGLRFSYGAMRGSGEARWAARTAELSAHPMIARAAAAGFHALWIDRRGFADYGAQLVTTLEWAGAKPIEVPGVDHLALFALPAAGVSRLPDVSELRWHEHWRPALAFEPVTVHAVAGWHPLETDAGREWRWAGAAAEFGLWNATDRPITLPLRFKAASLSPGLLHITAPNQRSLDLTVDNEPVSAELVLDLPPGATVVRLQFKGALVRPPGDTRELGFRVEDPVFVR